MNRQRIADIAAVGEGQTIKFQFRREGISYEGFLAKFQGKIVAYENRCRHILLTLDRGAHRFFTADGEHFACQNHGAMYEPLTGLCVRGPCEGLSLFPLAIEVKDGSVWLMEE